jgi:hypothetical protein
MMQIVDMTMQHAIHVSSRMRESDVMAWRPVMFEATAEEMAIGRAHAAGIKKAFLANEEPVAIGGFTLVFPNVWAAWFAAVPGWETWAKSVMRWFKLTVESLLETGAATRIQAVVLASDLRALRFVQWFGFEEEAICPGFAEGATFVVYRRLKWDS